ncbi:MAG: ATP-grasp domain-containing protein [Eubacteriales bacterium]|nr:ATP-grasp domain-containing protein [Eubacteriales bacterium]
MSQSFIPLLFAGDINVYSVARAFHEQYDIKASVFGKYLSGPCADSKIMNYIANPKIDQQDIFLEAVNEFAEKNKEQIILAIGCGDSYVQLLSQNRDNFRENVIAPYIDIELMNNLIHKEKFYNLCQESGINYPDTFVHRKELEKNFELPFEAPFIIKPSNGIEYWKHPFASQKKVYKAGSREELLRILDDIYGAGYDDSIIIQDFIPGDDTYMRVLTNYSDRNGNVKLMALGHVLLEEHTPHGIGNHAVIITEHNEEIAERFKKLLEDMHYIGFSNFDIKYDQRDKKYKVFEINTRQGRSNYYVTAAGQNIARYLVEDYIEQKPLDLKVVTEKSLWSVVPKGVAFRYIKPQEYKTEMRALIKSGQYVNPLFYKKDKGFLRTLRLLKSQLGHYYKYRKHLGRQN